MKLVFKKTIRLDLSGELINMGVFKTGIKTDSKEMLNKVPEIVLFFWIIKILCTTVGETAADYLNVNLNFGLTVTSIIMGVLLTATLIFQFRSKKYVPGIYWLTVFLISIFGTLVTDNLTDGLGVSLVTSTIIFSILLAITFGIWYYREKTLSIHSINTSKREAFYWLAILFTFALGTASGDLMAEGLGLGYLVTGIIVAVMIGAVIIAWKLKIDSVLAFWIAYILTRPMGASIGDYLSQSPASGGLGLGPTMTTFLFVMAILITVIYLSITKKDQIIKSVAAEHEKIERSERRHLVWQIVGMFLVLAIITTSGYFISHAQQKSVDPVTVSANAPLGDLSEFKTIVNDTLSLVKEGKLSDAKTRITDFETLWDDSQSKLKSMSPSDWSTIDVQSDKMLRAVRASHPDQTSCELELTTMMGLLNKLDNQNPA